MGLSLSSRWPLNDGAQMPVLGLGVWQARPGRETTDAAAAALREGYRLIDTAKLYENEAEVGEAVRRSGLPRAEVFVTTKLWNSDHGRAKAERAFSRSLEALGLEYVDLYLIHWPTSDLRLETWKTLEGLASTERCRSIGVSNFSVAHLEELLARTSVVPAVNQVEIHPYSCPIELVEFCRNHRIQVEAYSPLGRGRDLEDPVIQELAARHARTPAQVVLRWGLQHGWVVIPKSVQPHRIRENAAVFDFELSAPEMQQVDGLSTGSRYGTGTPSS